MRVTGHLLSQCTFTANGGSRPSNKEGEGGGGGGHPDPEISGAWSQFFFFGPSGDLGLYVCKGPCIDRSDKLNEDCNSTSLPTSRPHELK